jgi:CRISPR-associated protein Cas1
MKTLYLSEQGCYVSLRQETLQVKQGKTLLQTVALPGVEQLLVFGKSQVTTQALRACLQRRIPVAYLSRMGLCYGRLMPIEKSFPRVVRFQYQMAEAERLQVARQIVAAKLRNSRVLLQRQQRREATADFSNTLELLADLSQRTQTASSLDELMGLEGAGAARYFAALGQCITNPAFSLTTRNRRPPRDPVNAMLSFGYQVVWNHLLALIELQGLDPYCACLHQGSARHAALASDLIEEFRAPIVDSLMLYLVNRRVMDAEADFDRVEGACYLNDAGRKKWLRAFVQRMEAPIQTPLGEQPHWDLLNRQVKRYMICVYDPRRPYETYLVR